MSRIEALSRRYAAAAAVARNGVEIIVVADVGGSAFDRALRGVLGEVRDEESGPWDEVVGIGKALRWRRLTHPQPIEFNPALSEGHAQFVQHIERLRGAVSFGPALDALASSSAAMLAGDSPVGTLLARSVAEVGASDCAVVVASRAAQAGVRDWLGQSGIRVLIAGELDEADGESLTYAIGPPRFFPPALVSAPPTDEVTFLLPAWFADLSVPRSAISAYAEGALRIGSRVLREGADDVSTAAAAQTILEPIDEAKLQPAPVWGPIRKPNRPPEIGEVEAQKLLLAGGLALWLDDGDRIRAVDPRQPAGERVIYVDVGEVGVGTFLLVRTGITERRVLYDAALQQLGSLAQQVDQSQTAWKSTLSERIRSEGYNFVVSSLLARGVRTAERAKAWTDPNLIRPNSDTDFESTLKWLGVPRDPTVGYANRVRRALYQASADIREELETAVSQADLDALDRHGFLNLEVETTGFRGILATRVLAVSPITALIQRRDARVPFKDGGAQWLE
jgi:hypothetical protein